MATLGVRIEILHAASEKLQVALMREGTDWQVAPVAGDVIQPSGLGRELLTLGHLQVAHVEHWVGWAGRSDDVEHPERGASRAIIKVDRPEVLPDAELEAFSSCGWQVYDARDQLT